MHSSSSFSREKATSNRVIVKPMIPKLFIKVSIEVLKTPIRDKIQIMPNGILKIQPAILNFAGNI